MKQDKKQPSFVNISLSSLMVVFLVLCMGTFSILSLSSAKSDYTLSEKLAVHRTAYYEASGKAEQILSQIDTLLEETYLSSSKVSKDISRQDTYISDVFQLFQGYQVNETNVTAQNEENELILSYEVPLDQEQALCVRLKVTDPANTAQYYDILTWQVISVTEWEGNDTVNLIPMDN